jgi:hypothetical protein
MLFPMPAEIELEEYFAQPGRLLLLRAYEHPEGPFSSGRWIEYPATVMSVTATFNVSNERGFEAFGALPILRLEFP